MLDKENLTIDLREHLKKFPLYQEKDFVAVYQEKDSACIDYSANDSKYNSLKYFGLYIKGDICDINSPFIDSRDSRDDFKSILMNIIEQFCHEKFNCDTFRIVPSETSKKSRFWYNNGFRYLNAIVLEKTY